MDRGGTKGSIGARTGPCLLLRLLDWPCPPRMCQAVYFYHPLVRWLSTQLRWQQELAADDLAASALADRGLYLKAALRAWLLAVAATDVSGGHALVRHDRREPFTKDSDVAWNGKVPAVRLGDARTHGGSVGCSAGLLLATLGKRSDSARRTRGNDAALRDRLLGPGRKRLLRDSSGPPSESARHGQGEARTRRRSCGHSEETRFRPCRTN